MTGRRARRLLRTALSRPELLGILLAHAAVSVVIWLSGAVAGSYGLECQVGVVAWDLVHGLNPAVPLLDYFDTFTGVYLTEGAIAAPFVLAGIPTAVAIKLGCLVTNAAILLLAWIFLERTTGRTAALVGTLALALGPPALRHQSLAGPIYHYNELLFDFGMMVLWAEIVFGRRRHWGWYVTFGAVCGWGVTNCYGSAIFLAVILTLWWVCDRDVLRRPAAWAFVPALLAGLSPLLLKATVHRSYGLDVSGLRDFAVSHTGGPALTAPHLLDKLWRFVGGDYGGALGFLDTLAPIWGDGPALAVGQTYAALTLGAALLVAVLCRRGLVGGARGLVPMARFAPRPDAQVGLARLLPALLALALLAVYLTSNLTLKPPDSMESSLRDDRYLPPLTAMLALNLGIAAHLGFGRLSRLRALAGRPGLLMAVALALVGVALGGVCLRAQLALIDIEGLAESEGIPYLARCYGAEAHYAGAALRGDPARGIHFCSGFPEDHHGECYEGFAGTVGIDQLQRLHPPDRPLERLPDEVRLACTSLGATWRQPCFRRLGWYLAMESIRTERSWDDRVEATDQLCRGLAGPEERDWCREGLGWLFADFFGQTPYKLEAIIGYGLRGPEAMVPVARGVGSFLTSLYDDPRTVERACSRYDFPPVAAPACVQAAQELRELRRRPLPGGPVEPGPLEQVRGGGPR